MEKNDQYIIPSNEIIIMPESSPEKNRWNTFATLAMALGIIAICIHWLAFLQISLGVLAFIVVLGMTAAISGAVSSFGLIAENGRLGQEMMGFHAFLLGLGATILALSFHFLSRLILWGR